MSSFAFPLLATPKFKRFTSNEPIQPQKEPCPMKGRNTSSDSPKKARARGEPQLRLTRREVARMSAEDVQTLVRQLQVRQLELEVQNEELRRMQQKLEASRGGCADGYDFAPVTHLTLSAEGEILKANISAEHLLGLEGGRLIRQKFTRFISAEAQAAFDQFCRRVFRSKGWQATDLTLTTAQGKPVVVHVDAVRDTKHPRKQCRLCLRDLSERKQVEEALRASEERYRLLFTSSRDAIMTLEPPAWKFTSGNPSAVAMFRAGTLNEFVSFAPWELSPKYQPDGRPSAKAAKAMIETAMRRGSHFFEWLHRRSDGVEFPASVLLTRVEQGGKPFLQATVREITDRKLAEERITQLDRAKAILVGIDRVIVHVSDKQKLLGEVCRIAVEKGGFKLAWVGMIAPDGTVQPVAKAGETGYLDGLRVWPTLHDPAKCGPAGLAILENRPVVVGDIARDAFMVPWRDRALKFGLRYAAVFPIQTGNKVAGAFLVYAPQPDFFNENELALLTQVSGDVSFALTAMEELAARKQAENQLRKLSRAVEQNPASIVITDATGAIEYINPKFSQVSGYTAEEVCGKNPRMLKSGELPAGEYKRLWQTIKQGREWRGEFHNRKKNGELYWEFASISPIKNEDGRITHFVAVKEDITERKQAEEASRRSQERYVLTERAVNDGLWDWNLLTNEDHFSPRWKEILGYREDELPDDKSAFLKRVHPDDQAQVNDVTRNHLEKGGRYSMEFRLRHKDGSYRWVFSRGEAVRDATGRPVRMVGAITDISERKQAELTLIQSEERFSRMFKTIPIPVTLIRLADGSILDANDTFLHTCGYTREEVIGHAALELKAYPDPRQRRFIMEQLRKHGHLHGLEQTFRTKSGQLRNHLLWIEVIPINGEQCMLILGLDVTEQKEAEAELRNREQRYRQLFELESDAILVADQATHQILDVNRRGTQLYGYSREELLKLRLEDVSAEPESTKVSVAKKAARVPLRWHRKKNGERIAVEINTSFFEHQGRKLMLGAVRDITDRKQLEMAISAERERLEREVLRRIEMEQERIGRDLHDGLCQILVGAKCRIGALEKMLTDQNGSPAAAVAKAVEHMINSTIQQTRDLAKGLNPVSLERNGLVFALEELAKEVLATGAAHCRFRLYPATAVSDRNVAGHLYRITQEAVQNAIKHGRARKISITLRERAGQLVLMIEDDGSGFLARPEKSVGAGLHNMKMRAAVIGGTLAIRCGKRGGSVVSVSLAANEKQR
jgi:PAS domain S-box-containing protein